MIRSGGDRFVVRIPVKGEGAARGGSKRSAGSSWFPGQLRWREVDRWPCTVMLEASVVDHRLTVALDGAASFQAARL